MIDDPQQLQSRVNELRAMKAKYLKDIKRYKTESGMKLEEIARFQVQRFKKVYNVHMCIIGEEKCSEQRSQRARERTGEA